MRSERDAERLQDRLHRLLLAARPSAHRYISVKVREGVPITNIAAHVGHSRESLTLDTYAHVLIDERPWGLNVVSFTAHLSAAECGE